MLEALLRDIDAGLVSTFANTIRAETFDNFLDHAEAYRDRGEKDQAGVIACAVFEDTMRKIYADHIDKVTRPELEQVIVALTKGQVITEEQARQARYSPSSSVTRLFTRTGTGSLWMASTTRSRSRRL